MINENDTNKSGKILTEDTTPFFPVERLLLTARDLFEEVLPFNRHEEAIDNGLEQAIMLKRDLSPIKEVASLNQDTQIWLHENFCQFLWTFNYVAMVLNDCEFIKLGIVDGDGISKEQAAKLQREAKVMFDNAKKMFYPKDDNQEVMKADLRLMFESSNPYNKKNRYTELANDVTIAGISYLLHHEFGHFIYQHDDTSPKTESEADDHSFRTLLKWGKKLTTSEKPLDNHLVIGAMMALAATAFINQKIAVFGYPDLDDRIESLFKTYREISGREVYDSTLCILINGIGLWADFTKNKMPASYDTESLKEYLCRLREEYILPIKRREIII